MFALFLCLYLKCFFVDRLLFMEGLGSNNLKNIEKWKDIVVYVIKKKGNHY